MEKTRRTLWPASPIMVRWHSKTRLSLCRSSLSSVLLEKNPASTRQQIDPKSIRNRPEINPSRECFWKKTCAQVRRPRGEMWALFAVRAVWAKQARGCFRVCHQSGRLSGFGPGPCIGLQTGLLETLTKKPGRKNDPSFSRKTGFDPFLACVSFSIAVHDSSSPGPLHMKPRKQRKHYKIGVVFADFGNIVFPATLVFLVMLVTR